MKQPTSLLFLIIATLFPFYALAATPPIIIESVEVGSPAAADEYIALHNLGSAAIDISKWSIQCRSAGSSTVQKKNFTAGTIVQPGERFILANKDGRFATGAHMTYTTLNLVTQGGALGLFATTTYATTFEEPTLVSLFNYGGTTTSTPNQATETTVAPNISGSSISTKAVTTAQEYIGQIIDTPKKWPVQLNELLPNPETGDEYVEIINTSNEGIDVSGLWLRDASGAAYALGAHGENTVLGAYEMRIWKRVVTHIALNDTDGEMLLLADQSGLVIDRALYHTDAPDGAAYARFGNSWMWTTEQTPSNKNMFQPIEEPPVARAVIPTGPVKINEVVAVSAKDSTDLNDTIVRYIWNFGDGIQTEGVTSTHIYGATGTYTISLDVIDTYGAHDSISRNVLVTDNQKQKIAAAGLLVSKNSTATGHTTPSFSGIVQIPPGVLGHRRFIMNGRTVEFTTDRKELPLLQRGSIIQFTGRELFKTDRLLLQVTAKDKFLIKAITTAPPFSTLSGSILRVNHDSFELATTSTDYIVQSGTRYTNGSRVEPGDFVEIHGVLLTDDADQPTFAVPTIQDLKLIKKNSTTTSSTSWFSITLLLVSVVGFILLHLFLTQYGSHLSTTPTKEQLMNLCKKFKRVFRNPIDTQAH